MVEILFISFVIFYLLFWVYSIFKLINLTIESSWIKLLLILMLIFLQPLGLLVFWTYRIIGNKRNF